MKLDTSHLDRLPVLEVETTLRTYGYKTDVKAVRIVESESDADRAYVVKRVETTAVPFEEADIAQDTFETVLCSCPACRFQSLPDLSQEPMAKYSPCKHAQVFREERAKADENQATL